MRRWALEEMGRNSVSPCSSPRSNASPTVIALPPGYIAREEVSRALACGPIVPALPGIARMSRDPVISSQASWRATTVGRAIGMRGSATARDARTISCFPLSHARGDDYRLPAALACFHGLADDGHVLSLRSNAARPREKGCAFISPSSSRHVFLPRPVCGLPRLAYAPIQAYGQEPCDAPHN